VREASETFHLGRILEPWLRERDASDGWFFHSAGFMACHGSRKAPATAPCLIAPDEVARRLEIELAAQRMSHP